MLDKIEPATKGYCIHCGREYYVDFEESLPDHHEAKDGTPCFADSYKAEWGMRTEYEVVDLFAGPGGWDEGLKILGQKSVLGIEKDKNACETRIAAGHHTLGPGDGGDVSLLDPLTVSAEFGPFRGLIASPPCQDFSSAGLQKGLDGLHGKLVFEVLRWTDALRPQWVACEQVKEVLPIWKMFAGQMREWGYYVWYGILDAADFGVPQNRRRAFLLASRKPFVAPQPTHAEKAGEDLFGAALQPWVTMADALGWGRSDRIINTRGDRKTSGGNEFRADRPSWTLTEKTRSWLVRDPDFDLSVKSQAESDSQLETPPGLLEGDKTAGQTGCNHDVEPKITSDREQSFSENWTLRNGSAEAARSSSHNLNKPAPVIAFGHDADGWAWEPATTTDPSEVKSPAWRNDPNPPRQKKDGSVPIELWEGGVLQGFPRDYPWQGSKSRQFEQVGNAVPPLFAAKVVEVVIMANQE